MKTYFLIHDKEQTGPFTLEELKNQQMTRQTLVWTDGFEAWKFVGSVPELSSFIAPAIPPPPPVFLTEQIQSQQLDLKISPSSHPSNQHNKNRGSVWWGLGTVAAFLLAIGGLLLYNQSYSAGSYSDAASYEQKVMTIEEMENADPVRFLSTGGTYNRNFWGSKLRVQGKITNAATVATYKDAVVRFTYYSKTGTAISTFDHTVYETFPPTSSQAFELKIDNYKHVESVGWEVIQAAVK